MWFFIEEHNTAPCISTPRFYHVKGLNPEKVLIQESNYITLIPKKLNIQWEKKKSHEYTEPQC